MITAFNNHFLEKTKIKQACLEISGIGNKMVYQVLDSVGISHSVKIGLLSSAQLSRVKDIIEQNYDTDSQLRVCVTKNIAKFCSIQSYRGRRHTRGLPCRGQRTHSNARTCRRLRRK